jgi:hypothetical protein
MPAPRVVNHARPGWKGPPRKTAAEMVVEDVERWGELMRKRYVYDHWSLKELATELGIHFTRVRRALEAMDIKIRKANRWDISW